MPSKPRWNRRRMRCLRPGNEGRRRPDYVLPLPTIHVQPWRPGLPAVPVQCGAKRCTGRDVLRELQPRERAADGRCQVRQSSRVRRSGRCRKQKAALRPPPIIHGIASLVSHPWYPIHGVLSMAWYPCYSIHGISSMVSHHEPMDLRPVAPPWEVVLQSTLGGCL